jgi:opacity protein-like surface antigen
MASMTPYRVRNALTLLCFWLALAGRPAEAAAEGIFDAEAGLSHDNNLSRALAGTDIVSDTALNIAMSGGYYFVLGDRDSVTLTGNLGTSQFREFHGMSNVALGGTASWRRKFGVGAFVPWTSVSASLAEEQYGESIRNGLRTNVTLRAGKRVSEALELSGGGSFDRYRADDVVQGPTVPGVSISGDAFSLDGRSLFARADYAMSERWLVFAGISVRRGDVTASTRFHPETPILKYSTAFTRDPAFGSDYFAYRLTGTTWSYLAGMSLAMTDHSSLNFAVTRALTYASGGLDYQDTQVNATVIFNY